MRLEKLKVFADGRQNLVIFGLLRGILSNMQDVRFLIAHNFSLLLLNLLFLAFLGNSTDQGLIFGIFVNLISNLSHNIVDFVAELDNQLMTLQPKILLGPNQLYITIKIVNDLRNLIWSCTPLCIHCTACHCIGESAC